MHLKSSLILEQQSDSHLFQFIIPAGSHYGQAYDACFEMLKKIYELSGQQMESMKPQQENQHG